MNIKNILLLPAFVERAKDAARSVKQGVFVLITLVGDATLTHLLGLEQFEVTGYGIEREEKQDIVHLLWQNIILVILTTLVEPFIVPLPEAVV